MTSQDIKNYYDATEAREIRSDLTLAVQMVCDPKIAIDCGCGAGADIEYLLAAGFKVYGFDIEDESISRCKKRFKNGSDLLLTKASFSTFEYPKASLLVADASLFFCSKSEFNRAWRKIRECLYPGGIFCGSFLGPGDTMAGPGYDRSAFWPEISVFNEREVRALFTAYDICRFTEHKSSGVTPQGVPHDWHIFSVVAKKLEN